MKENRLISFLIVLIAYVIATIFGIITYNILDFDFYVNLLIADIVSTIIIFIFSIIFNNASMYDPYWSVAPVVVIVYASLTNPLNGPRILALIAILIWGIRLTYNWAYTFKGLNYEDWRYRMLREKTKKFYPIVNFLGIHLFPTIVVYFCMLPFVFLYKVNVQMNIFVIIFFVLSLMCPLLELIADTQMHKFRKEQTGTFIRTGLWKYSRHPNYLGEILMWWSIALMCIFAMGNLWILLIGAIINNLMFLFISIPMAENHQKSRKPGYEEYKSDTRMLLPIKKFKQKDDNEYAS